MSTELTRETFIHSIRDMVLVSVPGDKRDKLAKVRLCYGVGKSGIRGITYFDAWRNGKDESKADLVEIGACGEESAIQLAGTTLHELGHVVAGYGQGHNPMWKDACDMLGLRCAMAAGMKYYLSAFKPDIRPTIAELVNCLESSAPALASIYGAATIRPCPMGIGTRGGTSRGIGSGSRLRLYHCECPKPVKVRVASDNFSATCNHCKQSFILVNGVSYKLAS